MSILPFSWSLRLNWHLCHFVILLIILVIMFLQYSKRKVCQWVVRYQLLVEVCHLSSNRYLKMWWNGPIQIRDLSMRYVTNVFVKVFEIQYQISSYTVTVVSRASASTQELALATWMESAHSWVNVHSTTLVDTMYGNNSAYMDRHVPPNVIYV